MRYTRMAKQGEIRCSECKHGWKREKYRSHWRCTVDKNLSGGRSYPTGKNQTCDYAKPNPGLNPTAEKAHQHPCERPGSINSLPDRK